MKYFYRTLGALISVFSIGLFCIFSDHVFLPETVELVSVRGTVIEAEFLERDLVTRLEGKEGAFILPRWNGELAALNGKSERALGREALLQIVHRDSGQPIVLSMQLGNELVITAEQSIEHRKMLLSSARNICICMVLIGVVGGFIGDWLTAQGFNK